MGIVSNFIKLLIFKLANVKINRIVFTSFDGHYSDNSKYISEKIHELDDDIEIIWLLKPEFARDIPDYVKWEDIDTYKAQWYRGSAAVLVDNVYCGLSYTVMNNSFISKIKKLMFALLNNKNKQFAITTFHGTPLKRIGKDQIGNNVVDFICPNTTMILGNRYSSDIFSSVTFHKLPILLLGSPRNDILFDISNKNYFKSKLGLPFDKKIVLFAPTFRNDGLDVADKNIHRSGLNQLKEINFQELFYVLEKKFGDDWVFVCRFHYHVEKLVDWDSLNVLYPNQIINGNKNDDMAEYLACTDILITDSSSSMFDFMLTYRPCMLYFPDYDNYLNKERGFYKNLLELPFPLAITFDELVTNIMMFDDSKYIEGVEKLINEFGYIDDKDSAKRVSKYILKRLKNVF